MEMKQEENFCHEGVNIKVEIVTRDVLKSRILDYSLSL